MLSDSDTQLLCFSCFSWRVLWRLIDIAISRGDVRVEVIFIVYWLAELVFTGNLGSFERQGVRLPEASVLFPGINHPMVRLNIIDHLHCFQLDSRMINIDRRKLITSDSYKASSSPDCLVAVIVIFNAMAVMPFSQSTPLQNLTTAAGPGIWGPWNDVGFEMDKVPGTRLRYPELEKLTRVPSLGIDGASKDMKSFEMDEGLAGSGLSCSFVGFTTLVCCLPVIIIVWDQVWDNMITIVRNSLTFRGINAVWDKMITIVSNRTFVPRLVLQILMNIAVNEFFHDTPQQNFTRGGRWGAWNEVEFFEMALRNRQLITLVWLNIVLFHNYDTTLINVARNGVFHRGQELAQPAAVRHPVDNAIDFDQVRVVRQPDGTLNLAQPLNLGNPGFQDE